MMKTLIQINVANTLFVLGKVSIEFFVPIHLRSNSPALQNINESMFNSPSLIARNFHDRAPAVIMGLHDRDAIRSRAMVWPRLACAGVSALFTATAARSAALHAHRDLVDAASVRAESRQCSSVRELNGNVHEVDCEHSGPADCVARSSNVPGAR